MKHIVNEEKSISEDVKNITRFILNTIKEDAKNQPKIVRKNGYQMCFKENMIRVQLTQINDMLQNVTVYYVIYYVQSNEEIRYIESNEMLQHHSQYDRENNKLTIILYDLNGTLTLDTEGVIMHEITHFYQYEMGMEKRSDLYDMIVDMYRDKSNAERRLVGVGLYYTFPHEQDSFTHQFYADLKNGIVSGNFQETCHQFDSYMSFRAIRGMLLKNHSNEGIQEAIKELGYDTQTYLKRINFGWKRFKAKLKNAYLKHVKDLNENKIRLNRNDIPSQELLNEARFLFKHFSNPYRDATFKTEQYLVNDYQQNSPKGI